MSYVFRSIKMDPKGDSLPPPAILKVEQNRNENGNYKFQKPPSPSIKREQRNETRTITRTIKSTHKPEDPSKLGGQPRGVTKTRGFRPAGRGGSNSNRNPSKPLGSPQEETSDYILSQNFTNKNINQQSLSELEKEVSNLNIQESGNYGRGGKFNNARQASVPPRLQAEQRGGSKRYSSIRQRSLPETTANQSFTQQHPVIHYPQGNDEIKYRKTL